MLEKARCWLLFRHRFETREEERRLESGRSSIISSIISWGNESMVIWWSLRTGRRQDRPRVVSVTKVGDSVDRRKRPIRKTESNLLRLCNLDGSQPVRKEYDVRATLITPISARRRLTRHIPKSSLPQAHEPPATQTEFAYLECSFGLAVKSSMGVIPIGVPANATGALYAPKPSPTLALNDIQPVKFGLDES